ncbi:MAG: SAM-dependent methyltransferase [Gammaproteobacteria bacterium]|nr:SAM-dependent methyltransferase [Gammaproteobacteria bacterium]
MKQHQYLLFLSIALLSLAALGYEILLMRLFSIIQWHHFAYMIISLALLGYGASGAVITIFQRGLNRRFAVLFTAAIALFGISAIASFLLVQQLPFNAEEVMWDWRQPGWLLLMYLLLAIPFLFAASAIALALSHYSDMISKIYAYDLIGAGLGGACIILLLFKFMPFEVLAWIGVFALMATLLAAIALHSAAAWRVALLSILPAIAMIWIALHSAALISPYKELSQTLRIPGTEVVAQRSSPLGLLEIVESRQTPFRHAPGLSLKAEREPPPQVGIFTDGGNMSVITRDAGMSDAFAYLDQITSALPYHLRKLQQVLILGAGGGADVQQARYHQIPQITAVELNPQIVELMRSDYAEFSGHLYQQSDVEVHVEEARGFITDSSQHYDLIQVALMDAFGASTAGLYALNESYLYTLEAFKTYLQHLESDGYLSVSRWIKLPPRDTLKLMATAIQALKESGVEHPAQQLVLIRGWQTSTLLIKNGAFTSSEIDAVKAFCKTLGFDAAWYPGMQAGEANRFNQLRQPWFYQSAVFLLGDNAEQFMDDYKFDLRPSTDDRPYFFHFFKWSILPEILSLQGKGGMPLLEQGYLISVSTLLQALFASLLLIILPLLFLKRREAPAPQTIRRSSVLIYFFAIGLAFLFIEIAFIQKMTLLLHHPLYSAATVMTGFLIFAGLGSLFSQRLVNRGDVRRGVVFAVGGIAVFSLTYLLFFKHLPDALLSLPLAIKMLFAIVMIAPLATLMGMPFPLALSHLGQHARQLIPWAWGINGCASVISAILATLLAIHGGFSMVVTLAVLLYLLAALSFPLATSRE